MQYGLRLGTGAVTFGTEPQGKENET